MCIQNSPLPNYFPTVCYFLCFWDDWHLLWPCGDSTRWCESSRVCALRGHLGSLTLAAVGVFTPQKAASTTDRVCPPPESVGRPLPAHQCPRLRWLRNLTDNGLPEKSGDPQPLELSIGSLLHFSQTTDSFWASWTQFDCVKIISPLFLSLLEN